MKKMVVKRRGPVAQSGAISSGYDLSLAISYGTVISNNTNGTCIVKLITGFNVTVRIPSGFPPTKEPTTGSVHYPTKDSYVAIIHPKGDINSGFVFPATFDIRDEDVISDLLEAGDKTITDDGWTIERNRETGRISITRTNYSLTVDPDAETTVLNDFHDNNVTLDSDGVNINDTHGNTIVSGTDRLTINTHVEVHQ